MITTALIELRDLVLAAEIGTCGPGDVMPDAHILDLTLTISSDLVLVQADAMGQVFDYDPLIAEIDLIARSQHFETQEYLMTRIVQACARCDPVLALEIALAKRPVLGSTGSLGVRLKLDADDVARLRCPAAS